MQPNETELVNNTHKRKHKGNLIILGSVVIALFLAFWLYQRSHTVFIADARIASEVISISSDVNGRVMELLVTSGQKVSKGELLAQIDDRTAKLEIKDIELQIVIRKAEIQQITTQRKMIAELRESAYQVQQAKIDSANTLLVQANAKYQQSQNYFDRINALFSKKLASKNEWEKADLALTNAKQAQVKNSADMTQQKLVLINEKALLQEVEVLDQKINVMKQSILRLENRYEQQKIDLDNRKILSPINAVIDKTFIYSGEYTLPSRRMMMLHSSENLWIEANVKETEIAKLKLGSKAKVVIDAYPEQLFTATVVRIDHATTGEYALLPNPNPSGNFTKVTQRLRVRLDFQEKELQQNQSLELLKPGMMVEVSIDTRS